MRPHALPRHFVAAALWALPLLCSLSPALSAEISFNRDVRPILTEFCLHCHGPDEQHREADLRLDVADQALGNAIVPGKPEESELLLRIQTSDPDAKMPPPSAKKQLSEEQIETLRNWIAAGASYQGHWAFEPIRKPDPPAVENESLRPIDRFIVEQLQSRGLTLSPSVSRQQWIRRVTFDLIGLPPTWDEVQAFLDDNSDDAKETVINRLLASPRYGERWGRHWLDLARYADTHGGSAIGFTRFPFSYTYRDYVIAAFNNDLPYDRFVLEQLAADQLGLAPNDPALAALGFLTVGMQFRSRHDVIDDQIDVTTRGLLGLTVACARCHDHKYDPIPTTDYYSLYATFASSHAPELPPTLGPPPETPAYLAYAEELRRRQTIHDDLARDQSEVLRGRLRMQVGLYLRELAKGTPEQDVSAAFLSYRTDDIRPTVLTRWRNYLAKLPTDDPVFGPWLILSQWESESADSSELETTADDAFSTRLASLMSEWKQANGDPTEIEKQYTLGGNPPKWNPMILDALAAAKPSSLLEVADVYGNVFAKVNREWLTALLDASLEASPEGALVTDQSPQHRTINSAIDQQLRRHLYAPDSPTAMDQATATTLLNRTVRDALGGKRGAIDGLQLSSPGSPPRAMALEESIPESPFHVFRRGNPIDRGEVVQSHFLTALANLVDSPDRFPDGKRRLSLAQAIVDSDNPLLRRVIVNWVWLKHFGVGLVRTPDDFGTRSEPPTHPELLDYLAARFAEEGWSLKRLHAEILLTQTYAQASLENPDHRERDPDNRWLWRMPRRHLSMEAMRDAMLSVSGELDVNHRGGRPFEFLSQPIVPRRSVYGFVNRDIINTFASTFDGANPTSCTAKRPETTVPQQTLFALNSSFIQDRALAFARRAAELPSAEARVKWLYRTAYSREPDADEIETAVGYLGEGDPEGSLRQLAQVILASNEFVFVD